MCADNGHILIFTNKAIEYGGDEILTGQGESQDRIRISDGHFQRLATTTQDKQSDQNGHRTATHIGNFWHALLNRHTQE